MPHLVKYSNADGQPADHEVGELHDAIAYVERLRNEQGIEGAKIFRIEEVQFEFRPYYRVELGSAAMFAPSNPAPSAPAASVPTTGPLPEAPAAPAWAPPAETEPAPAGAAEADAPTEADADSMAAPAAALLADAEPAPMVDPWADAPPPPPAADAEHAANGRRGLFGR